VSPNVLYVSQGPLKSHTLFWSKQAFRLANRSYNLPKQPVNHPPKFQNKQKNGLISTEEGVFQNGFTLFIGYPYLKLQPHTGESITIDGVKYEVAASKSDMDMFEIDLFRNEEM